MANPLRERHHEDKQATKNAYRTKIEMAKFELRLDVDNGALILANSSHENLYAMEISPGGDMVQRIVVEYFVAMQHMRIMSHEGHDHAKVIERGEEATTNPKGLSYPKSKVSVRKDVDSKEHHSAAEADLPIAKEGTQMQDNG
ncbi:hypothetical protein BHE74_00056148 [Ensete ventricosum]|nr:hypothetical protein BHE74_00056148 [Ensete ventricosum]RZR93425.1 hypothetical protein BHM03_00021929 [Ensete ventricosum]